MSVCVTMRAGERALAGLGVQADPGHVRDFADVGFADTRNDDLVAQRGRHEFTSGARRNCGTLARPETCTQRVLSDPHAVHR